MGDGRAIRKIVERGKPDVVQRFQLTRQQEQQFEGAVQRNGFFALADDYNAGGNTAIVSDQATQRLEVTLRSKSHSVMVYGAQFCVEHNEVYRACATFGPRFLLYCPRPIGMKVTGQRCGVI